MDVPAGGSAAECAGCAHECDKDEMKRRIEAILFMSTEPIHLKTIAKMVGMGTYAGVKECAERLKEEYAARGGAVEIVSDDSAYFMKVRDAYLGIVAGIARNADLTKGELKVLAYVAKKEGKTGVVQSSVVKALGSGCYEHIHSLVEQKFINKRKNGRNWLLSTTPKFREYFNVNFGADNA
ncbi:MAG: SMC-Scp complex subunit ScpB [Candidatus Micrarchaeota archaeon]|nr:SMC-Scp complex subunit ScpB [Candidatus Micrarchaeota archaeon]